MGNINKKYKKSIVYDEVNKLIQDQLYKYITNKKVKVLSWNQKKETVLIKKI